MIATLYDRCGDHGRYHVARWTNGSGSETEPEFYAHLEHETIRQPRL